MKSVCAKSQTILLDFEMDMFYIYIYMLYECMCMALNRTRVKHFIWHFTWILT